MGRGSEDARIVLGEVHVRPVPANDAEAMPPAGDGRAWYPAAARVPNMRQSLQARSRDTDPEAERVQIALLRAAGVGRRAGMALSLSGTVITLARRAIRRSLAGATEQEVGLRFVELHYGGELASALRREIAARR